MHDPLLDTAVAHHRALATWPPDRRLAAELLFALPMDYPVAPVVGDCPNACDDEYCDCERPTIGHLICGALLAELRSGIATPETVLEILRGQRMIRPGITVPPNPNEAVA